MYLALREMNVRLPDLSVATIAAGREVPDFANWPVWTRKAMLEQQMVKWAPEGKLTPHDEVIIAKKVVQHLPSGPLGPPKSADEKVLEPALYTPAEPKLRAGAVDSELEVHPAAQKPAETIFQEARAPMMNDGVQVTTQSTAVKGAHDCHICGKTGFKDYNGLKIHLARSHKE